MEDFLKGVQWLEVEKPAGCQDGELYATHHGMLSLLGYEFRCYVLSNGQAVIDQQDMESFLRDALGR